MLGGRVIAVNWSERLPTLLLVQNVKTSYGVSARPRLILAVNRYWQTARGCLLVYYTAYIIFPCDVVFIFSILQENAIDQHICDILRLIFEKS